MHSSGRSECVGGLPRKGYRAGCEDMEVSGRRVRQAEGEVLEEVRRIVERICVRT